MQIHRDIQLREQEELMTAKEHEIQGLFQSHDRTIAAKEQENQQLIRELEQTKLRLNEKEQALKELERSMDQMQLEAKGESQKSADVKL